MTTSPTEISRLEKCLLDPAWRIRHLYTILDENGKSVPLQLRSEQDSFLRERHRRNFVPKARKLGLSTIIVLDNLDSCIFGRDTKAGIVDLTKDDAFAKLAIARHAWAEGPRHEDEGIAYLWRKLHEVLKMTKDSSSELRWSNGSEFSAGVAYTGRTPQRLHISEYGPISAQFPEKAAKILRGSINSVPPDGIVDIETTMEGGQFGECYQLFQLALQSEGKPITKLDWKLHFFPWWGHPSYDLPGHVPAKGETADYFSGLKKTHGLDIPLSRQAFYEKRKAEQGEQMWQQFPSVIEEVDRQIVPGQIYPEMKTVRAEGQVRAFAPEKGYPIFTSWDLGSSDNMAGWVIQPAGKAHNFLDWCCGEGAGAAGVAGVIREWESRHGEFSMHFLPHDCEITDKGSGKTFLQQLVECGIPRKKIAVVPRIPDTWVGIDEVRRILPNCWFHSRTDEAVNSETGTKLPSGVGRIEGYRKKMDKSTGVLRDVPVHDICSHTADALRTYAEALSNNLVQANIRKPQVQQVQVITGFRGRA
jgi:hypothetical protein